MSDLTKLTIAQARDAMRKGDTTSAEITSACPPENRLDQASARICRELGPMPRKRMLCRRSKLLVPAVSLTVFTFPT